MKALVTLLIPTLLFAGSALADASTDNLSQSLVAPTRKAMKVAPWIRVSVSEVTRADGLRWTASTATGLQFACGAGLTADGATAASDVACVRVAIDNRERLYRDHKFASRGPASARVPIPNPTDADYRTTQ